MLPPAGWLERSKGTVKVNFCRKPIDTRRVSIVCIHYTVQSVFM